jgi:hypothetical protein
VLFAPGFRQMLEPGGKDGAWVLVLCNGLATPTITPSMHEYRACHWECGAVECSLPAEHAGEDRRFQTAVISLGRAAAI